MPCWDERPKDGQQSDYAEFLALDRIVQLPFFILPVPDPTTRPLVADPEELIWH